MQISVSGKNMDTGKAFQEQAIATFDSVISKYFTDAISGHVTLEKYDFGFQVKARVVLSRRIELEATGCAPDAYAALETAVEHAEKRLRRHKRRLKNHRAALAQFAEENVLEASMQIYASADQLPEKVEEEGEDSLYPIFVDLSYEIEVMTVEQAVMKLELSNLNMVMFRNANHHGLNVVHFREDGAIGWIDPRGSRG